jgi:hypothetical protein
MPDEVLAFVPDRPVRVKITSPDGSSTKATLPRVPHESEWQEGEKYEVLDDEPASDVYGEPLGVEYDTPSETPPEQVASPAPKPAKKAASSEEGDK